MTDYIITQSDRTLTSSAIKIVKYENKVSRLVFQLDGTIDESLKLYIAAKNPKTGKYFFSLLLPDGDNYYYIVGTEMSMYTGKWIILLLGISPDYNLEETQELDDTMVVFSSMEFKKVVVLDTFIDDDAVQVTHPNIEKAMQDLVVLHDNVTTLALQTGEDVTQCENILQQCQNILAEINRIYSHMLLLENNMVSRYTELMNSMQANYSAYLADLRRERLGG